MNTDKAVFYGSGTTAKEKIILSGVVESGMIGTPPKIHFVAFPQDENGKTIYHDPNSVTPKETPCEN